MAVVGLWAPGYEESAVQGSAIICRRATGSATMAERALMARSAMMASRADTEQRRLTALRALDTSHIFTPAQTADINAQPAIPDMHG